MVLDLSAALLGSMVDPEVYLVDSEPDQHLDLENLAQGSTAWMNRSDLSAKIEYFASAVAPANDPNLTISGTAAHLSDLPCSLATYPMATWLSRPWVHPSCQRALHAFVQLQEPRA